MVNDFEDFVDDELFIRESRKCPMIRFGPAWEDQTDMYKIEYLWKLASSLNDAAQQIQKERDIANDLLFRKENQLTIGKGKLMQNQIMIQQQLRLANERHQKIIEENKGLYAEIKQLEGRLKMKNAREAELNKKIKALRDARSN